jgi:predicted nuclease of restriction endonuclease-like (RecB) superfamily
MKNKMMGPVNYNNLLDRIANILVEARTKVVREINKAQVLAYWEIGREIVEFEQKGKSRAEYGQRLLIKLSEDLTQKFGKGFSVDNLQLMRKFGMTFPGRQIYETPSRKSQKRQTLSDDFVQGQNFQTLSGKYETLSRKSSIPQTASTRFEPMLSWSHYCELLKVEEPLARSFYEQEAIQNNWSVRELKRQVNSMLFE